MSKAIMKIGNKEFDSQRKALEFYKNILSSYNFCETLNQDDFENILDLVYIDFKDDEEIKAYEEKTGDYIKSVIVDRHPDFRHVKCFFLINNLNEKQFFDYWLIINKENIPRFGIMVGDKDFSSKAKALEFYKNILNSYSFGETLNQDDFTNVFSLAYREYDSEEIKAYEEKTGDYLKSVIVDRHPDFRYIKCFFLINNSDEKQIFSYILAINGSLSDNQLFNRACRFVISERLRDFKKEQFKNRPVRCAITDEIVEWEECQVDHKSPLTFSVIVKSFIVSHKIDISSIEYIYDGSKEKFSDLELEKEFDLFHQQMAVLRILSTKQNNKLASGARIKPTKKDGTLI